MKVLVVKSEFGGHPRGSTISDPQAIEAIMAGEHAQHVIATENDEPSEPAKKKSK